MKTKFPGWRTMTGAERYNARMHALFEECKALERKRLAAGELPNPNLTDIDTIPCDTLRRIVGRAAGYRAYTHA